MVYNTSNGNAHISIQWGSNASTSTSPTIVLYDSVEWNNRCEKFRQYIIDSVKIEYTPLCNVSGSTEKHFTKMLYATSLDEIFDRTITLGYLEESIAYKTLDPSKPFTINVNCGKYYEKLNQAWMQPTVVLYTEAASHLRIYCSGYADGATVGTVTATYYVRCR